MKSKKTKAMALAIGAVLLVAFGGMMNAEATTFTDKDELLEFSRESERAIVGRSPDLGVSFSSVLEDEDFVVADIQLRDEKQLVVKFNYTEKSLDMQFISMETGELVELTEEDLSALHTLNVALLQCLQPKMHGRDVDVLLSTLGLFEGYPPGELLNVSEQGWTSLCDKIGEEITGTYTIWIFPITKKKTVGPCASDGCMGRCGAGCGWNPFGNPAYVQRFTQECFNHDLCTRATGNPFGQCMDEWILAAPGYLGAPDCNEIRGDWTVELTGTSCFDGDCGDIDYSVKVYHFSQEDKAFEGISDPSSTDGRVSKYNGIFQSGKQIKGKWKIPMYLGPECGDMPLGYASGTFKGDTNCGKMTMSLDGQWGWYYVDDCTFAGYGDFWGDATATRDVRDLNLEGRAEKRTTVEGGVAPCRPWSKIIADLPVSR